MDYAMTAPLKTVEGSDISAVMHGIGRQARSAARVLALAPTAGKEAALAAMAAAIRRHAGVILAANAQDLAEARASGATSAFLDRLALDDRRIGAMADGIERGGAKLEHPKLLVHGKRGASHQEPSHDQPQEERQCEAKQR